MIHPLLRIHLKHFDQWGGTGAITVNGAKVAEGRLERTEPGIFSVDDLADVGVDLGTPVTDYGASSRFNGTIQAASCWGVLWWGVDLERRPARRPDCVS